MKISFSKAVERLKCTQTIHEWNEVRAKIAKEVSDYPDYQKHLLGFIDSSGLITTIGLRGKLADDIRMQSIVDKAEWYDKLFNIKHYEKYTSD